MKTKGPETLIAMLGDDSAPLEHKKRLLMHIATAGDEGSEAAIVALCESVGRTNARSVYQAKKRQLQELIEQLESGPIRPATFLGAVTVPASKVPDGGTPASRALVVVEDGSSAIVPVPDATLLATLRRGDTVLLDGKARAILAKDPGTPVVGEEGRLERVLDPERIEVTLREHERHVFRVSEVLSGSIREDALEPGTPLLVCPRRMMAFAALPADERAGYRYLDRSPIPDVRIARDLGAAPGFLSAILARTRREMTDPARRRSYRLPRCMTWLLTGVSGSGKTFAIQALWRELYEQMSECTGIPLDALPPRVVRLAPSQILSEWLGRSDKNLARFFDDVERLATERVRTPDGREVELPVLAILEEVDGLARRRGGDQVYDRILTTALQKLDLSRPGLRDRLVVFVATTNVADQVDPAFLRRAGGQVEHFGRLSRRAFVSVLDKHLVERPIERNGSGEDVLAARRAVVGTVTATLFGGSDEAPGLVEVGLAGAPNPLVKRGRDFLTASIVERAVSESAERCCEDDRPIDASAVVSAFERQIGAIVDQLSPANVHEYVDLPDGQRAATVRRIPRPRLTTRSLIGASG
jgi:ATP-dependent 26S proteasome regulatory subunit